MPINSASFAKALWPVINKWYGREYDEHNVEWTDLFDQESSSRAHEEDVGTTGVGLAQVKTEGQALSYDEESQAYVTRYAHVVYAMGVIGTRKIYAGYQYVTVGKRRPNCWALP